MSARGCAANLAATARGWAGRCVRGARRGPRVPQPREGESSGRRWVLEWWFLSFFLFIYIFFYFYFLNFFIVILVSTSCWGREGGTGREMVSVCMC